MKTLNLQMRPEVPGLGSDLGPTKVTQLFLSFEAHSGV